MNEVLIRPDLLDLTEEKTEEDVVEEFKEEENGPGADCVSTVASIDSALNQVMMCLQSLEMHLQTCTTW